MLLFSRVFVPVARTRCLGNPRQSEGFIRSPVGMAEISLRGGATISDAGITTGVITDGTFAITGVTGSTGYICGTGGTYQTCQPASHASGSAAVPVSSPAAMIGTRSISQATSCVSLVRPDDVRPLTESRG